MVRERLQGRPGGGFKRQECTRYTSSLWVAKAYLHFVDDEYMPTTSDTCELLGYWRRGFYYAGVVD